MAQYARPDADLATGPAAWTRVNTTDATSGVTLTGSGSLGYQELDEASPDDTDYVRLATAATGSASYYEFRASDVEDPESSVGHVLRARAWKNSAAGEGINAKVALRQGNSTIATLTIPNLTTTPTTGAHTLSGAEADSITDYTDLRFRIWEESASAGTARSVRIGWVELEVPDVPQPPEEAPCQRMRLGKPRLHLNSPHHLG